MSKMEDGMENLFEGGAQAVFRQSLNPVQITKRAVKEMNRNKLVGSGRQYAPTLYNVLVSPVDDQKLIGFYPTLSREIENCLEGKAQEAGFDMDGQPLVRFIVDDTLRKGKFDVIAENVASPIVKKLRAEENFRYGIGPDPNAAPQPRHRGGYDDAYRGGYDEGPDTGYEDAAYRSRERRDLVEQARYDSNPGKAWAQEEFPPSTRGADAYGDEGRRRAPRGGHGGASATFIDVSTGEAFEVHSGGCMLGREEDCDVRLLDANVSRHHATIDHGPNGWTIEDLNSTNGTRLNGHRINRAPLKSGDVLTVGVTKLQFQER